MVSIEVFDGEEWVPITSQSSICYVSAGLGDPAAELESLVYVNSEGRADNKYSNSLFFKFGWTPEKKKSISCQASAGIGSPTTATEGYIYIDNEETTDKDFLSSLFFRF